MIKKTKTLRRIPSLMIAVALAGSASLCRAQSPIVYDFSSDLQGWTLNEPTGMTGATIAWNATNSSTGGGCMEMTFDGTDTTEVDPWVTLPSPLNESQYLSVTVHMMVDSSSGTTGTSGSGGYGNLQAVLRDSSYSWDSIWYGTLYPPAANSWVTYTFTIPQPYKTAEQYLQFQFQAANGSTAPVTVYIDNVTIEPVPDPWIMEAFTNNNFMSYISQGLSGTTTWDSSQDAPYTDPVTGAGPISITPPGSMEVQVPTPSSYSGLQVAESAWDPSRFQYLSLDVYYDGPTGGTENGGVQIFISDGAPYGYSWTWIGAINFTSAMQGKWTHFDLPCASFGITNAQGYVFQSTPGSDGGTNAITFHVDNVQAWTPQTRPTIGSLVKNTDPGGLKIALDADGTANANDQEGISSPSADNDADDFFWINQYPATYSFTLTNFPPPAPAFGNLTNAPASSGAGFDAHAYICNGDSITTFANDFGYNETYSGAPYNMVDYLGLRVENAYITNSTTYVTNDSVITTNISYGLSSGVVAIVDWKTNSPNANTTNLITFRFPNMASADGTWSLNFSDNTHGSVVAPDGSVNNFTLPDFVNDPNYTANFTPVTSMVQFGVFKNGNNDNNNLSTIFTHVLVTNSVLGTVYDDSFDGPGLSAKYAWQVAEYYQDAANRTTWIPSGTAYWLIWNATQGGFSVQSTSDLLGTWSDAGVTYTYHDGTGTNTVGAIPAASLPADNVGFFRLVK